MLETFQSLDLMLQVFWVLAAVSSLVFVIQAIGVFMGFDADADLDVSNIDTPDVDDSFDTDGFHLVSVKSIVSLVLGFSWTGVLFWDDFENKIYLGLLALVVGLSFMAIIAYLLYLVLKLDRDNTFKVEETIGKTAEVYLRIPAGKSDTGKVMVSLNGSTHELDAFSEGDEIPTGAKVKIVGIATGDTLIVEKC